MTPSCDKKFPNAYYMLATLFVETNIEEALRYCALAEKAENERLPFLQPVIIPQKKKNAHDQNFSERNLMLSLFDMKQHIAILNSNITHSTLSSFRMFVF
jgi:hypothetical protein